MARQAKQKLGILSKDEKIYIAEHFLKYDNEWISKKLKRGISYINTYVDRLKHTNKTNNEDVVSDTIEQPKTKDRKEPTRPKDIATVMTQGDASLPYRSKKYESPFKT